jgi:phosphoserine phosphatase
MSSNCRYYCYKNTRETIHSRELKPLKLKLVFFDMDGVITDTVSSWKYIHDYFETSNDKSVDRYLRGEIDDMEFIRRDVLLWRENDKPVTKDKLVSILSGVSLMKGARECISGLRRWGIKTAIVSAGLDILAERVADELGIDYVSANGLKTDNEGYLTGEGVLGVKLMYKDETIKQLVKRIGIPLEHCVAVGNSCFDIPMFKTCALGVAFNPQDDCVREEADVVIDGKDLSKFLPVTEPYIS